MPVSEAQLKATNKYNQKTYEKISVRYPKGTRDIWKDYAEKAGISLAEYLRQAVEEKAQRDGAAKG